MDRIPAAASAALGEPLERPVELGGSGRGRVVRCRVDGGGTVIVKTYPDISGFVAEAVGLPIAAGAGPGLLAADRSCCANSTPRAATCPPWARRCGPGAW